MKFKKWFSKNKEVNKDIKKVNFNTEIKIEKTEDTKVVEAKNIKLDPITEFDNYECEITEKLKLSRRKTYEGYLSMSPVDPKSLKIMYNNNILIDNGKSELVLKKDKKIKVGKVITTHGYYNINGDTKSIGKIPKSGVIAKYNIYHSN